MKPKSSALAGEFFTTELPGKSFTYYISFNITLNNKILYQNIAQDFPDGPVVENPPANAGDMDSIHMLWGN